MYNKLSNCLEQIRKKTDFVPEVALILGSGLGALADEIEQVAKVKYEEIDGFPKSTVEGHNGQFVFGYIGQVPVVIMQGRVHYYEGYDMQEVVMPTRLMKMMGAKVLFLTNAAGGINSGFNAGDFMIIDDHISSFVPSPLRGKNIDELGTRFPDMSHVYDKELSEIIRQTAKEEEIDIKHGVYLQTSGPNFETPSEIQMYKLLGADAVGMSTACEAIAAVHSGMRVCAVTCISNLASGISKTPLTHAEVQETADRVAPKFKSLIKKSIEKIGELK